MFKTQGNKVDEGWNAMQQLLDKEMPQPKRDNNAFLWPIGLIVIFLLGFGLGRLSIDDAKPIAESTPQVTPLSSTKIVSEKSSQIVSRSNATSDDILNEKDELTTPSEVESSKESINIVLEESYKVLELSSVVEVLDNSQEQSIHPIIDSELNEMYSESEKHSVSTIENAIMVDVIDHSPATIFAVSYMPRSRAKIKTNSKWAASLALLAGLNPSRNTQLTNIQSEWRYKLSKTTSVGISLGFGLEDQFLSESKETATLEGPAGTIRSEIPSVDQRNPGQTINVNAQQSNYTTGLVLKQKLTSRVYASVSSGVSLLQNSYNDGTYYKGAGREEIFYHWGGYGSLSIDVKLNKLLNFQLKGNRSFLVKKNEVFSPGNMNHFSSGINLNF